MKNLKPEKPRNKTSGQTFKPTVPLYAGHDQRFTSKISMHGGMLIYKI